MRNLIITGYLSTTKTEKKRYLKKINKDIDNVWLFKNHEKKIRGSILKHKLDKNGIFIKVEICSLSIDSIMKEIIDDKLTGFSFCYNEDIEELEEISLVKNPRDMGCHFKEVKLIY